MQIKICGITNYSDALLSVQAGAWGLGFNFYQGSKRYISPMKAQMIIERLPQHIKKIGIFVNESKENIKLIYQQTQIDFAQLHGNESFEFSQQLNLPVIKTVRPKTFKDIQECFSFKSLYAILVDAYHEHQFGGTNQLAAWDIAKKMASEFPVFLAGGINAENLTAAISCVVPKGLDLCSGVESLPGKKSKQKLQHFFFTLRGER